MTTTHSSSSRRAAHMMHKSPRKSTTVKSPSTSPESTSKKKRLLGGKEASKSSEPAPCTLSVASYETFLDEIVIQSLPQTDIETKAIDAAALTVNFFPNEVLELTGVFNTESWEETQTNAPNLEEDLQTVSPDFSVFGRDLKHGEPVPSIFSPSQNNVDNNSDNAKAFELVGNGEEEFSVITPDTFGDLYELKKAPGILLETSKETCDAQRRRDRVTLGKIIQRFKDCKRYGIHSFLSWRAPFLALIGLFLPLSVWMSLDMVGDKPMIPPPT